jgi:hypothetical protein
MSSMLMREVNTIGRKEVITSDLDHASPMAVRGDYFAMIAFRSSIGASIRRSGSKLLPVPWTVMVP